jgi:hypothetical protein
MFHCHWNGIYGIPQCHDFSVKPATSFSDHHHSFTIKITVWEVLSDNTIWLCFKPSKWLQNFRSCCVASHFGMFSNPVSFYDWREDSTCQCHVSYPVSLLSLKSINLVMYWKPASVVTNIKLTRSLLRRWRCPVPCRAVCHCLVLEDLFK